MKKRKLKFFSLTGMVLCGVGMTVTSLVALNSEKESSKDTFVAYGLDIADEDSQYLGYGYDVTSGKAISDPNALNLANPILDVNNPSLIAYEKAFSASQTTYLSYSSKSSQEMAEQYGMTLGGGVSGKIQVVTVSIDTKFNTQSSFSKKAEEEYSYFSIYAKNRTIVIQAGIDELVNFLSPNYLKDARNIVSENDANNFLNKYGTHLVTGYNLGGIFEMTNYYATSSSSYIRQNDISFSSQVNVALSNYGAGVNFSFSENYGSLDNNAFAVNNYKCTTYGGYTFPGLTIDQAFSFYQTAFGAGYIYGLWTDSINAGKNLSIVSIPESSKLIPLYNLLPDSNDYNNVREKLLESYIKRCGLTYAQFLEKYPEINSTVRPTSLSPLEIGYTGYGYTEYKEVGTSEYISTYVSSDDYKKSITVKKGNLISFDFNQNLYLGRNIEWKTNSSQFIHIIDARNGVFKIDESCNFGDEYEAWLEVDGIRIYGVYINVAKDKYFNGTGSSSDPFIIANEDDLLNLMNKDNKDDWASSFKLTSDIVISEASAELISPIGTKSNPFTGEFDGNFHSILNYRLFLNNSINGTTEDYGLFGYNKGTISNLTIGMVISENDSYDDNKNVITNFKPDDYSSFSKYGYISPDNLAIADEGVAEEAEGEKVLCNYDVKGNASSFLSTIKNIGGVVGYNAGTIVNCSVNNLDIRIARLISNQASGASETNPGSRTAIGAVCGYNSSVGILNNCYSKECSIRASIYSEKDNRDELDIGGIIGYNQSSTLVRHCGVDKLGAQGYVNDNDVNTKLKQCYVGGIIGHSVKGISDCSVTHIDGKTNGSIEDPNKHYLISFVRGNPSSSRICTGGFIGAVTLSSSDIIENCIGYEMDELYLFYVETKNNKLYFMKYFGGGHHYANAMNMSIDGNGASYIECYLDIALDGNSHLQIPSSDSVKVDVISWNSLSSASSGITTNGEWEKGDNDFPRLIVEKISFGDMSFDFSRAKKTFYYTKDGVEAFSTGEIVITTQTTSGDTIRIKDFTVDTEEFDKIVTENTREPDTCNIKVTVDKVFAKYQVKVINPSYIGIRCKEESAIKLDYYAGDLFNPKDLIVYPITETGVDVDNPLLTKEEAAKKDATDGTNLLANREYYEIEKLDTPLVHGFNNFKVKYFDINTNRELTTVYSVYAKSSSVKSLFVKKQPDDPSLPVGTSIIRPIDLKGMEIKVTLEPINELDALVSTQSGKPHSYSLMFEEEVLLRNKILVKYEDGSNYLEREIDANEVEIIAPVIKCDENKIKICFAGYNKDAEIIITGKSDNEQNKKLQRLIYLLKDFNEEDGKLNDGITKSLKERYDIIKEAIEIKDELAPLSGKEEYNNACLKLEQVINQYNNDVRGVNEAVLYSVRVSSSFYYAGLVNSGLLSISLIFALLLIIL